MHIFSVGTIDMLSDLLDALAFSHGCHSYWLKSHCEEQVQKVAVELLLDEQHHQPLPLLHVRVRPPHHQLQLLEVRCL